MVSPEQDVPELAKRVKRYLAERKRNALLGASVIATLSIIRGLQVLGIAWTLGLALGTAAVAVVALWAGVRIAFRRRQRHAPSGVVLSAAASLRAAETVGFQLTGDGARSALPAMFTGKFQLTGDGISWSPNSWFRRKGLTDVGLDRKTIRSVNTQAFPGIVTGTALEIRLLDGRRVFFYLTGPKEGEVIRAFESLDLRVQE